MAVLLLIVLGLVGLIFFVCKKPGGMPPGRWGLPIIGYCPVFWRTIPDVLHEFANKYGDIFCWKLGGQAFVFLNDYQLIKSTFSRPECLGRPDVFSKRAFSMHEENAGIVFSSGRVWQEGRKFALRHLKDFGLGRSSLEGIIHPSVSDLIAHLESCNGKPTQLSGALNIAVLNVIWRLVADRSYDINDPEVLKFEKMTNVNYDVIQGPGGLLDFFPWIYDITPTFILNKWMKIDKLDQNLQNFREFLKAIIDEHKATLNPSSPRDYIDTYLLEIEARKEDPNSTFRQDYADLIVSLSDLFGAGSETTSSTLRWVVLYMALHPNIQSKVQEEIDAVYPRDLLPSLNDRDKLPYTEAVLMETQRIASFLPLGVTHAATEDTKIAGYTIPKDTVLVPYIERCHRNPKYWTHPNDFYPEHFLDEQGRVLTKKEGYLPFALGRRQCLGESMARMELFLFTTGLLQRFTIKPPEGVQLTTETDRTRPIFNHTKPYEIIFSKRK